MADLSRYTIGWICAIDTEYTAARAFLDEDHGSPESIPVHDHNAYTLGRIGKHNVVIAVLPDGEYGLSTAGVVAQRMLGSFPNVRVGLMVGIGGGAPSQRPGRDIRLGDVVVSSPRDGHTGVLQYDFGKTIQDQEFKMTRSLNLPPDVLRAAVTKLRVTFEEEGNGFPEAIDAALSKRPRLRRKYGRPPAETDRLFLSHVVHDPTNPVEMPGTDLLVLRPERNEDDDNPAVFYGLIASANQLMKDANIRDKFAVEKDVLCFEMEAAGLMNHFPCLVIRGICDYSDSHKNKQWQGYAAMTAAAYAKALIYQIQTTRLESEKRAMEIVSDSIESVARDVAKVNTQIEFGFLDKLSVAKEAQHDNYLNEREPSCHHETRVDLLKDIQHWSENPGHRRIYWLSGSVGTGKTTIARTVARRFAEKQRIVATFFFKRGMASCNTGSALFSTLARQLARKISELPILLVDAIKKTDDISSRGIADQFQMLILQPLERIFAGVYGRKFDEVFRKVYKEVYTQAVAKNPSLPSSSSEPPDVALEHDVHTILRHVSSPAIEATTRFGHRLDPATSREMKQAETTLLATIEKMLAKAVEVLAKKGSRHGKLFCPAASKAAVDIAFRRAAEAAQAEIDGNTSFFLIIDALDECSVAGDIEILVPFLSQLANSKVCNAKIFITSRPEVAIRYTMEQNPGVYENILHRLAPQTVSGDIRVFVVDRLERIRQQWNTRKYNVPSQQLGAEWPGVWRIESLVSLADGLFLHAATSCRFIEAPLQNPEEQLSRILDAVTESGVNDKLSPTYLPILSQLNAGLNEREAAANFNHFERIVGSIVLLEEPLPVDSIAVLLNVRPIEVDQMLDPLISVFDIPEDRTLAIRPQHLSFRDFLLGPEAGDFGLNYEKLHRQLAIDCLEVLTKKHPLYYNMCGLAVDEPCPNSDFVSTRIPPVVQYACFHWVYHFAQGGLRITPDDRAHQFLTTYLLNWLEVLFVLGEASKAASMFDVLLSLTEIGAECNNKLFELLDDAWWFARHSFDEFACPLQIYWSGLIFAPRSSRVKQAFLNSIPAFTTFHKTPKPNWSPTFLRSLPREDSGYLVAAISPDSTIIATGHAVGLVRLWNTTNGQLLRSIDLKEKLFPRGRQTDVTPKEGTLIINALSFSDDSSRLVLGTSTCISAHFVNTGEEIWMISKLKATLNHLDVSKSQDMLASAHADGTIILWSLSKGAALSTLTSMRSQRGSQRDRLQAISFITFCSMPELIVGSSANDIYVWNVNTGQILDRFIQQSPVVGPINPVYGGPLVVFRQEDGLITVLDISNGKLKDTFIGSSDPMGVLAVSDDTGVIAYYEGYPFHRTSDTTQILIRDMEIKDAVHQIHTQWEVRSLLLSRDGRFLIQAGGVDLQIWAISPARQLHEPGNGIGQLAFQDHVVNYVSVHKSAEGSFIASYHPSQLIKIWSQETGQLTKTIHEPSMGTLELEPMLRQRLLSPNMEYVYEESWCGRHFIRRVQDSQSCVILLDDDRDLEGGQFAGFSADSKLVVVYSTKELGVWKTSGKRVFQDNLSCGCPITISADGKLVQYYVFDYDRITPGSISLKKKTLWTEASTIIDFPEDVSDTMNLTTSPDSEWIAHSKFDTFDQNYVISIWSVDGGVQIWLDARLSYVSSTTSISEGQSRTASVDAQGHARLYSSETSLSFLFSAECGDNGPQFSFRLAATHDEGRPSNEEIHVEPKWVKMYLGPPCDTDRGAVEVKPGGHGYGLEADGSWITWNDKRLLKLPPDMRIGGREDRFLLPGAKTFVVGDSAIAWVTKSGALAILGISQTVFPW